MRTRKQITSKILYMKQKYTFYYDNLFAESRREVKKSVFIMRLCGPYVTSHQ